MAKDFYSAFIPTGTPGMEGPVAVLEPGPIPVPQEDLYSAETFNALRDIERGTYALLLNNFGDDVLTADTTALFNELPDLGRTRNNNKHLVKFGQLLVNSPFSDERVELVAIKPFDRPREAATEFSLTQYFSVGAQRAFQTFRSLGFVRTEDGKFGHITKYEHSVRSLDNVFLNPEYDDRSMVMHRAVGKCAYLLASMHAEGYTHGDAQAKNMFVSNSFVDTAERERVFIADLESTRPFPHSGGIVKEFPTEQQVNRDLNTLVDSMHQVEGGRREIPQEICEMFALIYTSIVNAPKSEMPPTVRKSSAQIREFFDPGYIAS